MTTPDTYQFHRLLVRLTGAGAQIPVAQITVRVASSSGAVDTSKVKEWPGGKPAAARRRLPAGLLQPLQDPTENRAQLDRLAAEFPNLVTAVNLPHLSPGYQRKAQTIARRLGRRGHGQQPARAVHQPDRQPDRRRGAQGRRPVLEGLGP